MTRWDQDLFNRDRESWVGMRGAELAGFLTPKCQHILTEEGLQQALAKETPLRIKYGIDPTGADVHMGHVVPVMLLRQFEKAGHTIDLIIGDFTARVGDPSGRESARAPLTEEQIRQNMATYRDQMSRFVDIARVTFHTNSSWLERMNLAHIFDVFHGINLTEAMQREDFRARVRNSQGVTLAEACYGVLMGLDSLALKSDIEVGGIDQLLNFQQCRKVMRQRGLAEEVVLMTGLIEGTSGDGRKMSKSFENYIAVTAPAEDKFGKIMSIPDRLIAPYFISFGHVHQRDLPALQAFIAQEPMEAKKQLGTLVAALADRDLDAGLAAREAFERKFSKKDLAETDYIPLTATPGAKVLDVLFASGKYASKGDVRRLLTQQAVRTLGDTETILGVDSTVSAPCQIRAGKRDCFRITLENGAG